MQGHVQKAHHRVEAGAPAGLYRLRVQQGVAQGKAGVDRVGGRAAAAALEAERRREQAGVGAEIGRRAAAFITADSGAVGRAPYSLLYPFQRIERVAKRFTQVRPRRLRVAQHARLRAQLRAHHAARPRRRPGFVAQPPALRDARTGVARRCAQYVGDTVAITSAQGHHADPHVGQRRQAGAADLRVGAQHHPLHQPHRHAAQALAIDAQFDRAVAHPQRHAAPVQIQCAHVDSPLVKKFAVFGRHAHAHYMHLRALVEPQENHAVFVGVDQFAQRAHGLLQFAAGEPAFVHRFLAADRVRLHHLEGAPQAPRAGDVVTDDEQVTQHGERPVDSM